MIWYGMIWYDVMWCDVMWYDMIQYDSYFSFSYGLSLNCAAPYMYIIMLYNQDTGKALENVHSQSTAQQVPHLHMPWLHIAHDRVSSKSHGLYMVFWHLYHILTTRISFCLLCAVSLEGINYVVGGFLPWFFIWLFHVVSLHSSAINHIYLESRPSPGSIVS